MSRCGRLALVGLFAVAACNGSSSSSSSSSTTGAASGSTTGAASAVPKGKPLGTLSLTGDSGLTAAVSDLSIRCDFPDLQGESIAVLGMARESSTQLRVGVLAGKVTVRLFSTGADGQFQERAFEGTGVTGFDAKKGAQIDSPLTETAATKDAVPGSLGAVTAVKGSIDCHGQEPGSSALTLTGETADGKLDGATLEHVRVECNKDALGNEAVVLGLITVGSTRAFVAVSLTLDGVGVTETFESQAQRKYQAPKGSATITSIGGHASGDAIEQDATPPHTIHVEGDVTCAEPATG